MRLDGKAASKQQYYTPALRELSFTYILVAKNRLDFSACSQLLIQLHAAVSPSYTADIRRLSESG